MGKLTKLRNLFAENDVDGLLITSHFNRRYMTNFTGTSGVALISADKAVFITDFRYTEQATAQATDYEIVKHNNDILPTIAEQVKALGIKRLGFEQDYLSFATYTSYREEIKAEMVPVSGLVEQLRMIKTPEEINILKDAAKIADETFAHILTFIGPGKTEKEVANELEFHMRKLGAKSSSFDIIVASGVRSALPHGVASNKVIAAGELVTMDFGAVYNGYISDITRTVAIGEVSDQLKNIYDVVLEAQLNGVKHTKAGMAGKEADALTRDIIEAKGFGDYFGHGTGHGIGVEVHEAPRLSPMSAVVLEAGMTVTVEPGIYIPNVGGVRIEDDILITKTGNERLTNATKEFIMI